MVEAEERDWYLVQHKPNSAKKAQTNLDRQGFRTFMPLRLETTRRNGRFNKALTPLFPGYLFVALTRAKGGWHTINSTFGVSRLVSFSDSPARVPRAIVDGILDRCDETGTYDPRSVFRPGQRVKLTAGPFADFFAQVEQVASDQRVWLLLEMLGRQARLAVDHRAIERVPATSGPEGSSIIV